MLSRSISANTTPAAMPETQLICRTKELTTMNSASNDTNTNYFDSNNGAITGAVKDDDENRIPDVPIHLQGLEGT